VLGFAGCVTNIRRRRRRINRVAFHTGTLLAMKLRIAADTGSGGVSQLAEMKISGD
jgi:hypothetical protein